MAFMTEEQVRLLHKLQVAGFPAFADANPMTLSSEEASDLFRNNLPPLEWLDATGVTEDHEFIEKRFMGVTENNCREQMNDWLEKEKLTLLQQPNPQFGTGEAWFDYFSQPMESINFKALEDHFKKWEMNAPQIPIPKDQQEVIGQKPPIKPQDIYQRLNPEETQKTLANLRAGNGLDEGIQLGFAPDDLHHFADDRTFHTFLSPLKELKPGELLAPPENIVGQLEIGEVFSEVDAKPYYGRLSPEEVKAEIEYFQERGHFRSDINIGMDSGVKSNSSSIKPFVNDLLPEELDLLEDGKFPHPERLSGQKLLGYTVPQNVGIYRRLTPEEVAAELKNYAAEKKFSSDKISIGHVPERETHKKEFPAPLVLLSDKDIKALADGQSIKNQEILQAQKFICRTPELPATPIFETKFSGLELAFDDCPEERLDLYIQNRKDVDERAMNKITPEQRAMIKALQAVGKGPKIERDAYLKFSGKDAAAYIKENENNPENTFAAVAYPQRQQTVKTEAFPDIKKSNLIYYPKADYLQRSIIRDLASEGHLATPETRQELLDKLEFVTANQAAEMMEPHMDKSAGNGLLDQCKSYIESGKILNFGEIKTIADVQQLYSSKRNYDFDMKAALRDLVEGGYIQSEDAMAKILYSPKALDEALIRKYGDAPIGNNLRNRLYSLMDDGQIGGMEDEQFKKLTIYDGMQIISSNSEIQKFKDPKPATPGQLELLKKMMGKGIIDPEKVKLKGMTFQTAHYTIEQNIEKMYPKQSMPLATDSQKKLLKILIDNRLSPPMTYDELKVLTIADASKRISEVPEEKRKELFEKISPNSPVKPPAKTVAPER